MISSMAFRDPQLIFRTWQTSFLDHPLLAASVMNISVSLTTPLPFSWPAAADSGNWHCLGSSVNEPLVVIVLLHFHRRRASFFESGASLLRLPACQKRQCLLWMSLSIAMRAVLGPIEESRTNIPTIRLEWIVKKPKLGVGFRFSGAVSINSLSLLDGPDSIGWYHLGRLLQAFIIPAWHRALSSVDTIHLLACT